MQEGTKTTTHRQQSPSGNLQLQSGQTTDEKRGIRYKQMLALNAEVVLFCQGQVGRNTP
jgi:hypothetical protein